MTNDITHFMLLAPPPPTGGEIVIPKAPNRFEIKLGAKGKIAPT